MSPYLVLNDVYIDIAGHLRRGQIKFTDQSIGYKERITGRTKVIHVKDLMRIENVFLGTKRGIRLTTKNGDLLRFGQLSGPQLENVRVFMAVNWKKKLLKLDPVTKKWIFELDESAPANKWIFELDESVPANVESKKQNMLSKLKKRVTWTKVPTISSQKALKIHPIIHKKKDNPKVMSRWFSGQRKVRR
uniref:FACT complex subunit SSRP1/POB3 N-terminal PH domain-containing protein n=1 Tax=Panagrolaimus sp. JU765 TaxID=591449 RepID=A0AC34RDV7_9BILA